ncbi:MAG: hypothetical protein KAT11_00870 [Phycisphaerae bacterium]|nr:hypothetical protein [Phycisphaerae bacterium]
MSKRYLLAIVLAIIVWAVPGSVLFAQAAKPAETPPRGPTASDSRDEPNEEDYREVTLRIRVTWDPKVLRFDQEGIVKLLTQRVNVQGLSKGIKKLLQDEWTGLSFRRSAVYMKDVSSRGLILGDYRMDYLHSIADEAQARKVLEAVVDQLRQLLEQEYGEYVAMKGHELHAMEMNRERAEIDLHDSQVRLEEFIRAEKLHPAAKSDLLWKIEKNRSLISDFERQLQKLDIEHYAKNQRLLALRHEIAKIAPTGTTDRSKDDAITAQLAKIVEIRKEEIGKRQKAAEGARGTASELRQAEVERAKAEIELARRRKDLLRASGDLELLAKLKAEQSSLILDLCEMQGRNDTTDIKLASARKKMAQVLDRLQNWEIKLPEAERMKSDLSLARKRYEQAVMLSDQARRELEAARRMGPRVTIIDAKKEKASGAK